MRITINNGKYSFEYNHWIGRITVQSMTGRSKSSQLRDVMSHFPLRRVVKHLVASHQIEDNIPGFKEALRKALQNPSYRGWSGVELFV